ncbi:NAD(+)/NADH kinase [candidate division KSB1 bacterium]|nr:NAD(+)/NADH kinase [candidate division KSB1 bacterium]
MIFGILGNTQKERVRQLVPQLMDWLQANQIPFILADDLYKYLELNDSAIRWMSIEKVAQTAQIIIAFGGDGTILGTARSIGKSGIPILGVNLGRLGFLAEISPEELFQRIEEILNDNYGIIERSVLQASIKSGKGYQKVYALNDIVVEKGYYSGLIQLDVFIDEEYLNRYRCDGVIISSPTGSTAYSLSAGGPILENAVKAMIINPICPHSLGARPVVISDEREVKVAACSKASTIMLSSDGQFSRPLAPGDEVTIRKAEYSLKWVKCFGKSFYDVLRTKLNWGD